MNAATLPELIDFAISEEHKAKTLYASLAARITDKGTRRMLIEMAEMEAGHESRLRELKTGTLPKLASGKAAPNLEIAEYLVENKLHENSGIQDVILFSIQAEKKAHALYTDLAGKIQDPAVRSLMLALAAEEAGHKNSLEKAYDDNIFREN